MISMPNTLKRVNMSESRILLRAWAQQEAGRRAWPVYVTPMKWVRQGGFPVRDTCKECAATNGQRSARHKQLHDAQALKRMNNKNKKKKKKKKHYMNNRRTGDIVIKINKKKA